LAQVFDILEADRDASQPPPPALTAWRLAAHEEKACPLEEGAQLLAVGGCFSTRLVSQGFHRGSVLRDASCPPTCTPGASKLGAAAAELGA